MLWLASVSALHLWDDERWNVLSERHVYLAREAGALSELTIALGSRIYMHLFKGELSAAQALVEEVNFAMEVTGSDLTPKTRQIIEGRLRDGDAPAEDPSADTQLPMAAALILGSPEFQRQ